CVSLQSSMELMKEITTLEIEIMRLERYLLSLYRTAFQQNLPLLLENQKIHSQGKISSPTQCTTDQSYSDVEIDTSICGADQYDRISAAHALTGEKLTDSAHRSLADHLTASRMDDVLSYPDRLSEEIVKCISCIYCKFANPKILATKGLSVSSTSSLSSSSTFSPRNLSGSWSSHHNEESTEQYEFEVCKDDNRPYSTMIEILKICLDDDSFNYATTMLHKFRSLVKSLEKVDPRNMRREEKLTFWINIHNALVMHAYLAYGTQNSVRSSSILKIQVYTAKNVFQDLKVAKEEFIRATVCINKDKRIYLPKIICYFAKDMSLSTDEVVETVMGSLPETQMKLVRSCMEYRADKLIYWLPQSCTFRYLIQKQVIQGRLSI
uniref:Electron transporter n=1 Tax=Solanum tuberosum TaxID=4113 RepID=M1ALY0_SOLTU